MQGSHHHSLNKNQIPNTFLVKPDSVEQEGYVAQAHSRTEISSHYQSPGKKSPTGQPIPENRWLLSSDISNYPSYYSQQILVEALYNLSLEEIKLNIEADQTFRTGEKWEGVWTRDVSYSILLGLGLLEPEISKNSLRRKVKSGRIVQDTGTGGAYPVSSDRVVWALAAFEVFQITGEQDWLAEIYPIIKQSLQDDLRNVYDPITGLVKGESSFLDWREQTYPHWMQPADIYESLTLATNAVHYQSNTILAILAKEVGEMEVAEVHNALANKIKKGINKHLWMAEKGYYGQYLYGRIHKVLSPRAEALGEALCVLFDIAEDKQQEEVISQTPITPFGIASIFPQTTDIPPYHNDGIWPFVQAFWSLAAAKAGNEAALTESLDAIYRAAALFLTNKENFVAQSGDYAGTQTNSNRQLWSVAGNLGMVYKVFFGLGVENDYLTFKPFVPQKYAGTKQLQRLKIRKAVLDLEIHGFGNQIKSIAMDGQPLDQPQIPLSLEGQHKVKIMLTNVVGPENKINRQAVRFTPSTPNVTLQDSLLTWDQQEDVAHFKVLRNGKEYARTDQTQLKIKKEEYAVFQVIAFNKREDESFASEPISVFEPHRSSILELEEFAGPVLTTHEGYHGRGYIEISKTVNRTISFSLDLPENGRYAISIIYSNGNGPVNTENRCALRALYKEDDFLGTFVFPQRGMGNWTEWGDSNVIQIHLKKGNHQFTLSFAPFSENMNGEINQALLDQVRVLKIRQ
jgi:hypothetical protein